MPNQSFQLARRDLLKLSAAGLITTSSVPWFEALATDAARQPSRRKACILLWMDGGPSQQHTFDPKPGGEYKSIETSLPGVHICEYLPRLARVMEDVVLLRGMSTGEGDHYRAKYYLHTGYQRLGSFEHPAIGCIASHEVGYQDGQLPSFVTIDAGFDKGNGGRLYRSVPAYLGPRHAPLAVRDPDKGLENLPAVPDDPELAARLELLRRAEQRFAADWGAPIVGARQAAFERAVALMRSRAAKAFKLDEETTTVREAYGSHKFGKACLMARRLVEAGVSFIEIFHRGWDDHEGAAKRVAPRCEWMDPAMAALITDLKNRGLLDDTLIVWMGEFGRSPGTGSNHYARAWTTLLAGGGLKTGQVIGKTDEKPKNPGGTVIDRPVSVPDFFATISRALGIDPAKEVQAAGDRPMRLVDKTGRVIEELFA
jgi:hypothetical protein